MSYILDALKKAERERGLTEIPTLETVHDFPVKKKTGVWIAAGCVVAGLITVAWLFFPASPERVQPNVPPPAAITTDSAKNSEPEPERREAVTGSPQTPALDSAVGNTPIPKTPTAPVAAAPEAGNQLAPSVVITDSSVPRKASKPNEVAQIDFTLNRFDIGDDMRESLRRSMILPSLREVASSMKISIHVYSDEPDERLVFINGKKYKEGDSPSEDCIIESITPEGVILKRGKETISLRAGG